MSKRGSGKGPAEATQLEGLEVRFQLGSVLSAHFSNRKLQSSQGKRWKSDLRCLSLGGEKSLGPGHDLAIEIWRNLDYSGMAAAARVASWGPRFLCVFLK